MGFLPVPPPASSTELGRTVAQDRITLSPTVTALGLLPEEQPHIFGGCNNFLGGMNLESSDPEVTKRLVREEPSGKEGCFTEAAPFDPAGSNK